MARTMTGGCQCGRVRYAVEVENADAILCHCSMCRRATGGAFTPYVSVSTAGLRWQGEPDRYQSSPIAHRPFCSRCGTPLGFAVLDEGDKLDLTLGSFDDPGFFVPTCNYAVEGLLPAWQDTAHLPRMRSDENPGVAQRWMDKVGKLPD